MHRYAFDTAVQILPVPELVPFRLTQTLQGALLPHDAIHILTVLIEASLRSLRAGAVVLQGIMEVFCREPVSDWAAEVGRLRTHVDASTHVQTKVAWSLQKLAGRHPAAIMEDELAPQHEGRSHWEALRRNVWGEGGIRARAEKRMIDAAASLSPAQQAECLLDMATDPNLLGRMYYGWKPWL